MPEPAVLGPLLSEHRRTVTYRVIVLILTALSLSICWALYQTTESVTAVAAAFAILPAAAWFCVSQARERLHVFKDGVEFSRSRVVWRVAWRDVAGVLFIFHENDLGEVRIGTRQGERRRFDLNWKRRTELEQALLEALKDCPPLGLPILSPHFLGVRLGSAIARLLRRDGSA